MPFNKCTAEPVSRDPKLEVFLKAWDFLAKAKAYVFSFHKLEGLKTCMFYFGKEDQIPRRYKLRSFSTYYKYLQRFQSEPLEVWPFFSVSETSSFGLRTWAQVKIQTAQELERERYRALAVLCNLEYSQGNRPNWKLFLLPCYQANHSLADVGINDNI